jgi:hypothetical protein
MSKQKRTIGGRSQNHVMEIAAIPDREGWAVRIGVPCLGPPPLNHSNDSRTAKMGT